MNAGHTNKLKENEIKEINLGNINSRNLYITKFMVSKKKYSLQYIQIETIFSTSFLNL